MTSKARQEAADSRARRDAAFAPIRRSAESKLVNHSRAAAKKLGAMVKAAEEELKANRLVTLARFDHANYLGTPPTYANATKTRQGPLARLYMAGGLTIDQLAYAVEIAMVAEMIERDVGPGMMSYEPRVDTGSRYGKIKASLVEGIMRVRREVAYTHWRKWLPAPKRAVLDMIIGDPIPYSTAALRYGMHKRRAKRLLVRALDLWPVAMEKAEEEVDDATLAAAHAAIL